MKVRGENSVFCLLEKKIWGMTAPLTLADALENAQKRVSDLLQHPDDLTVKLDQLRRKFAAEKASVDAILKTSVQAQLDDTHEGLGLVMGAYDVMNMIKGNLKSIDANCLSSRTNIPNYPAVKKVSLAFLGSGFQCLGIAYSPKLCQDQECGHKISATE
jgi:hypothetical protein